MWRAPLLPVMPLAILLTIAPLLAAACPCMIQFGVCDETRQSDAVFIGTVESVAPPFLDPFARSKGTAALPAAETARLQADASPEAIAKLKQIYLDMFKGMPDDVRSRIAAAQTQHDLEAEFEAVQSEGRVARFRVGMLFKNEDDDDQPPGNGDKDQDDNDTPKYLNIWTGSGDCGIDFQAGETYLVYAIQDEDSARLETSACMRTRRLSEEKGDLGFLYFLLHGEKESTRLEGFISTSFADQSLPRYEDSISTPSPGAIVELDTGDGMRYTQSDHDGRFSFDGLKKGDYNISVLAPGFPRSPRNVLLTRGFHADESSCARQILVVPPGH